MTITSKEYLESEVARLMKELQTANNEVDKLHNEAANLSDNLAKSELHRSQLVDKEKMKADLEMRNDELISKFMAISYKSI